MAGDEVQVSDVVFRERSRLLSFIRRRVPNASDAEDILQDVFYELVEANRLLMPIDHVTGWLFRVARNRIIDLFRKKHIEVMREPPRSPDDAEDEPLRLEDLLPSADAGPAELYQRGLLVDALGLALEALPVEQREVFVQHEIEGRSFKDISRATGVNVNTLLSRKRYAVLQLRDHLQVAYSELQKTRM